MTALLWDMADNPLTSVQIMAMWVAVVLIGVALIYYPAARLTLLAVVLWVGVDVLWFWMAQ